MKMKRGVSSLLAVLMLLSILAGSAWAQPLDQGRSSVAPGLETDAWIGLSGAPDRAVRAGGGNSPLSRDGADGWAGNHRAGGGRPFCASARAGRADPDSELGDSMAGNRRMMKT